MPTHHRAPTTFTPEQLLHAVKGWCWDCGARCPDYILHNEVWRAAWTDDEWLGEKRRLRLKQAATKHFPERPRSPHSNLVKVHVRLCFGCLELRLKRHLRVADFQATTRGGEPVPENAGIFLGFLLGYRQQLREAKKAAESGDKKDEGG